MLKVFSTVIITLQGCHREQLKKSVFWQFRSGPQHYYTPGCNKTMELSNKLINWMRENKWEIARERMSEKEQQRENEWEIARENEWERAKEIERERETEKLLPWSYLCHVYPGQGLHFSGSGRDILNDDLPESDLIPPDYVLCHQRYQLQQNLKVEHHLLHYDIYKQYLDQ